MQYISKKDIAQNLDVRQKFNELKKMKLCFFSYVK